MFVSKRAFVVVVSLALAVGCGSASEEGSDSPASGDPSSSTAENAATSSGSSTSSTSEGSGTGAGGAGGEGTGASSGGSSSGGITPANVPPALTCTQCSAFAADQANGGVKDAWELCNAESAGVPGSYALYAEYLGCLCSGPCVNECETSLCALQPTDASATCKSCLALNNAACSSSKSACLADK